MPTTKEQFTSHMTSLGSLDVSNRYIGKTVTFNSFTYLSFLRSDLTLVVVVGDVVDVIVFIQLTPLESLTLKSS